jgi:hypothetical protein
MMSPAPIDRPTQSFYTSHHKGVVISLQDYKPGAAVGSCRLEKQVFCEE